MENYTISFKAGVIYTADAKTLIGAKREATRNACYGFQSVSIFEGEAEGINPCDTPICFKKENENWVNID